jgi:hypothetical protein
MKRVYRVPRNGHPDDISESAQRAQKMQRAQSAPIDGLDCSYRQSSHFSQNSARTASTEYSLWKDPDLEWKL